MRVLLARSSQKVSSLATSTSRHLGTCMRRGRSRLSSQSNFCSVHPCHSILVIGSENNQRLSGNFLMTIRLYGYPPSSQNLGPPMLICTGFLHRIIHQHLHLYALISRPPPYADPNLRAPAPLRLAPIRTSAKVHSCATEITTRTTQSRRTLLIHNRTTRLSFLRCSWSSRRHRGFGLGITFSEASLAAGAAIDRLVLYVVLRATMAGRGAAAVEIAVDTGTRAGYTALSVAADVDIGDGRSVG